MRASPPFPSHCASMNLPLSRPRPLSPPPPAVLAFSIVVLTATIFWPVQDCDFLHNDDVKYVVNNTWVAQGLTWENTFWAFRTTYFSNWHPLTWLSYMLDVELFGFSPKSFHRTNLLIHIINTVLLLAFLWRATRRPWSSVLVCVLFAVHPLRVESVAWISERKDVLSTTFLLLTLLAYTSYVRSERLGPYGLVVFTFALGLMAKPMLVTLPFVLLLLDHWPLSRRQRRCWTSLLVEKTPLFALSVASSVVTLIAQSQGAAMSRFETLPWIYRLGNACVSYVGYLTKTLWPVGLSPFYPHPGTDLSLLSAAGAAATLLAITVGVARYARHRPYYAVGWLWFLGTLVPVIGLVQVGAQAMADRYTYVPLIGIFIMIAWGVRDVVILASERRFLLATMGAALLLLLCIVTKTQLTYWRDSVSLYRRALAVTRENDVAHHNLAVALASDGRFEEAVHHFREAVRIYPDASYYHFNLAQAEYRRGDIAIAIQQCREALQLEPEHFGAQLVLGFALLDQSAPEAALAAFEAALGSRPESPEALDGKGRALMAINRFEEAISSFEAALGLRKHDEDTLVNLAYAIWRTGATDRAAAVLEQALLLTPQVTGRVYLNLGQIREQQGRTEEALRCFEEAWRRDRSLREARTAIERLRRPSRVLPVGGAGSAENAATTCDG